MDENRNKKLSEMTLEELWELFPIFLVPHHARWAEDYHDMKDFLDKILAGCRIRRISHIGSTAIQEIWAKNIIDMLVELDLAENMEDVAKVIVDNGFTCMSSDADRASFHWGYTERGFAEKVYHLHLRRVGDNDELYFRDYLNEHSRIAKEYEQLKLNLWKQYEHNRDGYTQAKSDFVKKWTVEAKKIYGNRYSG